MTLFLTLNLHRILDVRYLYSPAPEGWDEIVTTISAAKDLSPANLT